MTEYIYNKQFPNETRIRIETNNRNFFIGIEQTINDFITQFTNENAFKNEETDGFEPNQNELVDLNRNEERRTVGNEDRNRFENFRGNELQKPNKPIKSPKRTKLYPPIDTKFGRAYWSGRAYFIRDENYPQNLNKLLHRLIYEDYHKCTLLHDAHIHHLDRNPANNDINNLQLISPSKHSKLHSENRTLNSLVKQSKTRNTSGYFRVCKLKDKRRQNNDMWRYLYPEDGKQKAIVAKTIPELEQKVKAKKLPWKKL